MKRLLANLFSMILGAALALAAVWLLLVATWSIEQMASPVMRALAIAAALGLGVVLLLGSIFIATRLAVRLASGHSEPHRPPATTESEPEKDARRQG